MLQRVSVNETIVLSRLRVQEIALNLRAHAVFIREFYLRLCEGQVWNRRVHGLVKNVVFAELRQQRRVTWRRRQTARVREVVTLRCHT